MLTTNDQTIKADGGKLRLSLVPPQIIRDIAQVRMYGCEKYGDPDNWRRVEKERYLDALLRHTLAYLEDPKGLDAESGLPHYKHMACNMAFLCEMEKEETQMASCKICGNKEPVMYCVCAGCMGKLGHQWISVKERLPEISIHAPREGCDSKLYQRAGSLLGSICLFAQGEEG